MDRRQSSIVPTEQSEEFKNVVILVLRNEDIKLSELLLRIKEKRTVIYDKITVVDALQYRTLPFQIEFVPALIIAEKSSMEPIEIYYGDSAELWCEQLFDGKKLNKILTRLKYSVSINVDTIAGKSIQSGKIKEGINPFMIVDKKPDKSN